MTTSAFGVELGDVSKGVLGASKKVRRASGAAKAHTMIASKYEAANRGRPGAVTPAAGTRFNAATARRRMALNERRGHNTGNASFHREQAATKLSKSAFGVDLTAAGVVEKALSDPNGNMFQRPSRKNTRGQNAQAGATVGGAEYGAVGVAAGAAGARHRAAGNSHALGRAAEGIFHSGKQPTASSLKRSASVGRTLSRVKGGSKGAAVGAALGVGFGAGIGAIQPARKDGKKLPKGRVS